MTRYVALDPGVTTGIAAWEDTDRDRFWCSEFEGHIELWDTLVDVRPDVLIYEAFNWRPHLGQGQGGAERHVVLTSAEHIGIIKLYSELTQSLELVEQQPSMAKGFWGDDSKIKTLGLWEKGSPHAMDALRHLLYHLTFTVNGDSKWLLERLKDD